MLSKLRQAWKLHAPLWIFLFCVLLFAWWILAFTICATEYGSPNICIVRGPLSATGRFWHFIRIHGDTFLALIGTIATVTIAAFTGTLWRATNTQAELTRVIAKANIRSANAAIGVELPRF